MEELFKQAMQQAAALKKQPESVPWENDEPWAQPFHRWSAEKDAWEPVKLPASRNAEQTTSGGDGLTSLALYTWNIDAIVPASEARMDAALAHLQELTGQLLSTPTTAVVIFLQECIPSDLKTIGQKQWIRDRFYLTDIDDSTWASGAYGTTTLVDRRLDVSSCFRVHYSKTKMERDALFVDAAIPTPSSELSKTLRLCNTHLESLAPVPPLRPSQMQLVAKYMHADGLSGAIVAGDFNGIQPEDESLHIDNDLKDAYLEVGGQPGGKDEGFTWGQQAHPGLRERFGLSRMDKVFFCGESLRLLKFKRFGEDVVVDEAQKEQRNELLALGFEKAWVTDHLGLNAVFSFANDTTS